MSEITKGSCNCGGVKWQVEGEMRPVIACHCGQCRKQTGLYYAASAATDDTLSVTGNEKHDLVSILPRCQARLL